MSEPILFEREGDVARITIDRPDDGNRVSNEMGKTLGDRLLQAGAEAKLVVLRGAGADFCTGRLGGRPDTPLSALALRAATADPALALYEAFRRCRAPILGIVQGRAEGFGCAVAALCDITLVSDAARFRIPEMDHDLPPTLLMSALADRVPLKAVMYYVYSRSPFDPATALAIGIASKVVPAGALEDEAKALTAALAERSQASLRAVKEYMRSAPQMSPLAASDFAANLISNVLSSPR